MGKIPEEIVRFFKKRNFVIVSTIGSNGIPHSSCKGLVKITGYGKLYIMDLYKGNTHRNLKKNSRMSITAVDEDSFTGYCLKGSAKIVKRDKLSPSILRAWRKMLVRRISQRLIKSIHGEKGHPAHPEAALPRPEYLIVMELRKIVDLAPHPETYRKKINE
ncbi:MAG: pyridoxamine 5'-phosphate oxidase family protein [Candidatus Tritonobacter lacicola]|nr:pyridoxamine 5'-phosphate oxidase family protein [Candidatus Tritonobacter lacicola]